jgi:four helix bundle protein
MEDKQTIRSFQDLDVYQTAYQSMLDVFNSILPYLPAEERYDLADQLRRSTKAIPRLISEGYAKKHQKKGFQKYLDDAMAESNEIIVSLSQAKDLYASHIDIKICEQLIDTYDKISRQCYNLAIAWDRFNERKSKTKPLDTTDTSRANDKRYTTSQ